ncbi:hypothetical protein [Microbacterium sp. 70-16]|uniref:hypothetical protein n=2 Tax=Microbacterium TaxID=33882 RepID=UPI00262A7BDF|nr:hypothetical protein [Microbacterium sp. 70-16]
MMPPTLFASVASLLLAIEHERADPERVRELVSSARPGWLADLGWVTLARKALLSADVPTARAYMERIGSSDPVLTDRRDKLVTLIAGREGRFEEARSSLEAWSADARETPGFADLHGHIEFWNGNFDQASGWFAEAAERAERRGDILEAARGLRHLARALALAGDAAAPRAIELATEANAAIDSAIGLAQLEASEAILRAREGDAVGADQLLQSARDALGQAGAVNDVMTTRLLELVTAMIAGDAPREDTLAESIAGLGTDGPAAVAGTIAALLRGQGRQSSQVELSDIGATAARWRAAAMAAT